MNQILSKKIILTFIFTIFFSLGFTITAWTTKFIVSYDPRTGISTLGVGTGKVKAITKDIEKLIATAKQITVDKRGNITAIIDMDPKKIQQLFGDKKFSGSGTGTEEILMSISSPVNGGEYLTKNIKIEGIIKNSDVKRVDITVKLEQSRSKGGKRFRARVKKGGGFSAIAQLYKGDNIITIAARSKDGKSVKKLFKISYNPGEGFEIKLSSPISGQTVSSKNTQVIGEIIGEEVSSVSIAINGSDKRTAKVSNNKFSTNINLGEGKNYIEISATGRQKSAKAISEIFFVPIADKVGTPPTSPTLIFEQGSSHGQFSLSGTVWATPAVEEVVVYVNTRHYSRVRVEKKRFVAVIMLNDIIEQIKIVPVWKDKEYTDAAAIYKDLKSPTVQIILPIPNTEYNTHTTTPPGSNVINTEGVVTDDLLMKVEYSVNQDTRIPITYAGINIINFSQPTKLYKGQNCIFVRATDYFGNTSVNSVNIDYISKQKEFDITLVNPLSESIITDGDQQIEFRWKAVNSITDRYQYIFMISTPLMKEVCLKNTMQQTFCNLSFAEFKALSDKYPSSYYQWGVVAVKDDIRVGKSKPFKFIFNVESDEKTEILKTNHETIEALVERLKNAFERENPVEFISCFSGSEFYSPIKGFETRENILQAITTVFNNNSIMKLYIEQISSNYTENYMEVSLRIKWEGNYNSLSERILDNFTMKFRAVPNGEKLEITRLEEFSSSGGFNIMTGGTIGIGEKKVETGDTGNLRMNW
ncbi:hypothetical protein KAJ27_12545 [bacterium]|nr:hypothetical protein [bacterium]